MTVNRLYDRCFQQLCQLWPDQRLNRLRLMAWFLVGLFLARSVHLARIANHIPSAARLPSLERRLSRLLANPALRVRDLYAPLVQDLVRAAGSVGELRLILDSTKVTAHHQLLLVCLAYRRRALPLAWTWVRHVKGHSTAHKQLALLTSLRPLLPPGVPVLVVGDCEFGPMETACQLDHWGWKYVLRQKGNRLLYPEDQLTGEQLGQLGLRAGERIWWPHSRLTKRHGYGLNVLGYWQTGEPEPWFLATNLDQPREVVRAYRRRMWIDEFFGDVKGHGVELEKTQLVHVARLSRLVLLVALLYLGVISLGARSLKAGKRPWVDRVDRRDLSLFQIGWRLIQRRLTNAQNLPELRFHVPF